MFPMKAAHTPHQPTDKIPVFAGCAHSLIKPFTTQRLKSHTSTSQGSMSRTESHDDGFGNRAYRRVSNFICSRFLSGWKI